MVVLFSLFFLSCLVLSCLVLHRINIKLSSPCVADLISSLKSISQSVNATCSLHHGTSRLVTFCHTTSHHVTLYRIYRIIGDGRLRQSIYTILIFYSFIQFYSFILYYSFSLFYSILFYSILFYSILFYRALVTNSSNKSYLHRVISFLSSPFPRSANQQRNSALLENENHSYKIKALEQARVRGPGSLLLLSYFVLFSLFYNYSLIPLFFSSICHLFSSDPSFIDIAHCTAGYSLSLIALFTTPFPIP